MRRSMIPALVTLCALVTAVAGEAKTYRWVNERGVVTYSDTPPQLVPVTGERDTLIEEAIELSGFRQQVEAMPAALQAQVEAAPGPVAPADRARLARALAGAFKPEAILAAAREGFRKGYEPELMGRVVAQLRNPVLRRMAALELAAGRPEARQELQRFAAGLKQNLPPAGRLGLIQRLAAATGLGELHAEATLAGIRAGFKLAEATTPPERRPKPEALEQAVRVLEARRNELAAGAIVTMLFTYRDAREVELEEYVAFVETDHGRWFAGIQRQALLEAVRGLEAHVARQAASGGTPPAPRR